MYIAIIGTAGRSSSQLAALNTVVFDEMTNLAMGQIREWGFENLSQVILVSGGSAWADHVAVRLFLDRIEEWGGLQLFLPCRFSPDTKQFDSTACGKSLNRYHEQQSSKMNRCSRQDLAAAIALGAQVETIRKGFKGRNTAVANQADYMIALTFSSSADAPDHNSRGTLDTWSKCHGVKKHFSLQL